MPSAKKTAKHSAGKAPISGKKAKQITTKAARIAFSPAAPSAPDSLALAKIEVNATTAKERHAAAPVAAVSTGLPVVAASKLAFKVVLLGPVGSNAGVSFDCPAILDLLDLVRQRHAVKIENGVPFPNSLTINGISPYTVRFAHDDINGFMHNLRLPDQHQLFMVQPSDDQHKKIVLIRDVSNPELARSSFKDGIGGMKSESVDKKWLTQQTSAFRVQFAKFANILRSVTSSLYMQVHLGRLLLCVQEDQGPVTLGGAAAQLDLAIAKSTAQGSIVFDRRIGGTEMFGAMQQQVFQSRDAFYPCSSVLESLLDVEPQRFLVGVMESFRFELEIGPPDSAPDKRSASLSHLRVFQTLGSEGKAGLTIACPNHDIDWNLETVPELVPGEIPSTIKSFVEGVTVVYSKERGDFPTPIIRTGLSKEHRVKQLFGKTAWTVGCKGTRYMLELSLYHKFSKSRLAEEPQDQALMGVSILNSDWEEALKSPAIAGGVRDPGGNWGRLFRPNTGSGAHGDGIDPFLELVGRILNLWDRANGDVARVAAPRPAVGNASPTVPPSHPEPPTTMKKQQSSPVDLLSGQSTTESHRSYHLAAVSGSQAEVDLLIFD